MTFIKRLTATHKTELFLLALAAAFDLSFGLEKLFIWIGRPLNDGWLALLYITFGLIVAAVGVYNLVSDINTDCQESPKQPEPDLTKIKPGTILRIDPIKFREKP